MLKRETENKIKKKVAPRNFFSSQKYVSSNFWENDRTKIRKT